MNVAWVVLHCNRRIGAREHRQLIPHVRFQVPFLGPESQLKSGFACAGLLCTPLKQKPKTKQTTNKQGKTKQTKTKQKPNHKTQANNKTTKKNTTTNETISGVVATTISHRSESGEKMADCVPYKLVISDWSAYFTTAGTIC